MKGGREYERLVERARADDDVLGLVLTGSRGRGPFARPDSDWDVRLVVRDQAHRAAVDRYATPHGSPVEVAVLSQSGFEQAGTIGSDNEWDRYSYAHAQVVVDKLAGELEAGVSQKGVLTESEASIIATRALDAYVNSYFRSSTNLAAGRLLEGRLDAAESISPLLTALFALHRRVRPFNKFLVWELESAPLGAEPFGRDRLVKTLTSIASTGDLSAQQALFVHVERLARSLGFGQTFDDWGPELPWLRGASRS